MRKWPRERDRKDQQEKRAWNQNPLLWYLCHHHRWSIRLNIICLPEQDMTRETEREKGRGKKMTHLLQCWQMWRHRRTFPSKKNKKKHSTQEKWHQPFTIFTANSSHGPHASSIPAFPNHLFLSKGGNFVFVSIFSICSPRKEINVCYTLRFSLPFSAQPCLLDICSYLFIECLCWSSTVSCNWAKALFW